MQITRGRRLASTTIYHDEKYNVLQVLSLEAVTIIIALLVQLTRCVNGLVKFDNLFLLEFITDVVRENAMIIIPTWRVITAAAGTRFGYTHFRHEAKTIIANYEQHP